MAETNANESADQRREKLKALRERRGPGNRKPAAATPGAGAGAGGGEDGGDRRAKLRQIMQQRAGGGAKAGAKAGGKMGGKLGAKMGGKMGGKMGAKAGGKMGAKAGGGAGGDKRAKLMKAMKNPQQREKLMERFPQLREKMGGAGGKGAKGAKGAKAAAARRGGAAGGSDPALGRQVKALEGRVAELERELKNVRSDAPKKPSGAK
ncbi:MAG: hypothetical protein AAF184_06320 [Pseudomonadota bacterium]